MSSTFCFGIEWKTTTPADIRNVNVNAIENKYGWTPLHLAASNNQNPEIIQALVNANANTEARNKDG